MECLLYSAIIERETAKLIFHKQLLPTIQFTPSPPKKSIGKQNNISINLLKFKKKTERKQNKHCKNIEEKLAKKKKQR